MRYGIVEGCATTGTEHGKTDVVRDYFRVGIQVK